MAALRAVFGDLVVAGAIRAECERVGPGQMVHSTPFASIELAPAPVLLERAELLAAEVRATGLTCAVRDSEAAVLWGKLAVLAPMALATASAGRPLDTDAQRVSWHRPSLLGLGRAWVSGGFLSGRAQRRHS